MKDTMNKVALELEGVKLEDVTYFDKHYKSKTDYDWVSLYALGVHGIDWRLGGGFIEKCFKRTMTLRRYKGLMKINWKGEYEINGDTKPLNFLHFVGSDVSIKCYSELWERKLRMIDAVGSNLTVDHLFAASGYEIFGGSKVVINNLVKKPHPGSYTEIRVTLTSRSELGSTFELSSKYKTDTPLRLNIIVYSSNNKIRLDLKNIPNASVYIEFCHLPGNIEAKNNIAEIKGVHNPDNIQIEMKGEELNKVIPWTEKN